MTATPISAKVNTVFGEPSTEGAWPERDVIRREMELTFGPNDLSVGDIDAFIEAKRAGKKIKITIEVID